jgi:hypothetical protein
MKLPLEPMDVILALRPLAKELKMESINVEIKQWDGSDAYVNATLYSKEKNKNNASKISISADTPVESFSKEALIFKLRADYLEQTAKH